MPGRILVVDDSRSIIALLKCTLENAGYEVFDALNGEDGLERLDETGDIDLIICDLNMPKVDGMAMLCKVKHSERYSKTPFLMLTTEAREEMRDQAMSEGVNAWIIKPFSEEQLLSAVSRLIG